MKTLYFLIKLSIFIFISICIIIVSLYTNAYFSKPIELNSVGTYYLYDNKDNLIYQGSNKSEWISIDNISKDLINAVISVG